MKKILVNRYTEAAKVLKGNDFKNGLDMKKLGLASGINHVLFYNLLAIKALSEEHYNKVAEGKQSYNWAYKEALAESKEV